MSVRPLTRVPLPIRLTLTLALVLQVAWHASLPPLVAKASDLPVPPSTGVLRVVALGEPVALAKLLNLWLQAFDYQSGLSLAFRDLDYDRVILWLQRTLELDPHGQYPLMAASRLYAEVGVEAKQRQMIGFVRSEFIKAPNERWPWLAHVAILAKHRLNDLPLALEMAQEIARHATGPDVPSWARQMEIPILEDLGEIDSARFLIGGLLSQGGVHDPRELHFLEQRLQELESKR